MYLHWFLFNNIYICISIHQLKDCLSHRFLTIPWPPGKMTASKLLTSSLDRSFICIVPWPWLNRADSIIMFLKKKQFGIRWSLYFKIYYNVNYHYNVMLLQKIPCCISKNQWHSQKTWCFHGTFLLFSQVEWNTQKGYMKGCVVSKCYISF